VTIGVSRAFLAYPSPGGDECAIRSGWRALPSNWKEGALCPVGEDYLRKLADLLHEDVYPSPQEPFEMTVKRKTNKGWPYISIDEVLTVQDKWLALIHDTRAQFSAVQASAA
jgi:hypothetical protein